MGRYTDAVCKKCRREGLKLFLKGARCNSSKCAIDRRAFAPGQHGKSRSKLSEYGLQLRAKQRAKVYYRVSESQFRKYYDEAFRKEGITSDTLFQQLELRLDNVAYRIGLGMSRAESRQLVGYGMVQVNNKNVNIPSYLVKIGDTVTIRESKKDNKAVTTVLEINKSKTIPSWIEMNKDKFEAKIIRKPVREDVDLEVAENLIVELYSKN
ncbi:MAG: 30S ribosomal protein S4 [Clostridia bacterium]|nr:30S ribosomal protein S4 [Clostridia bacterium]MDD4386389.1 30S ribosomal protein S4 [Clostridia bacterium]